MAEVTFTVTYERDTDANSYENLIENLRTAVTGTPTPTLYNAFRVLPNPNAVRDPARFVLVTLTSVGKKSITLAIDVTDLYVVGYRTGNVSFFFKEYEENIKNQRPFKDLFGNTSPRQPLSFNGGYDDLVRHVPRKKGESVDRDTIKLGIQELNFGIEELSRTVTTGDQNFRARPLIVVIQMVSEAVRLDYIRREVQNLIRRSESAPPSNPAIDYEDKWEPLSRAIQEAIDGRFRKPFELFRRKFYSVDSELKNDVKVLKYTAT